MEIEFRSRNYILSKNVQNVFAKNWHRNKDLGFQCTRFNNKDVYLEMLVDNVVVELEKYDQPILFSWFKKNKWRWIKQPKVRKKRKKKSKIEYIKKMNTGSERNNRKGK